MTKPLDFDHWKNDRQQQIESLLTAIFEPSVEGLPKGMQTLQKAMQYALLNGGKRFRALLAMAVGEWLNVPVSALKPIVIAIECVHAYSLVHDDLPCMDDDDLRRGKPTCHKIYGDAMAVLAGDALQTLAFEQLMRHKNAVALMPTLLHASGAYGMVGGQAIDCFAELNPSTVDSGDIEAMHTLKTGKLIEASVELAMRCQYPPTLTLSQQHTLLAFAKKMGVLYQVIDDVLDALQTTERLGKTAGKDEKNKKATYVTKHGLDEARSMVSSLREAMQNDLNALTTETMPYPHRLDELVCYTIERTH